MPFSFFYTFVYQMDHDVYYECFLAASREAQWHGRLNMNKARTIAIDM